MKTAQLIKGPYPRFQGGGTRCLWRTSTGEHIITSSIAHIPMGIYPVGETMAFLADADGNITDLSELACTGYDRHTECITDAGYEVVS